MFHRCGKAFRKMQTAIFDKTTANKHFFLVPGYSAVKVNYVSKGII